MEQLEKIWKLTDPIFDWIGWHYFKWVTGLIIATGLVWFIWNLNTDPNIMDFIYHIPFISKYFPIILK